MQHRPRATGPTAASPSPDARRPLRIACVTETYPPEVNGVSLTVARMVEGLRALDHEVQLLRPRQAGERPLLTVPRSREVLLPGLPIPRYSGLRMGMPSGRALAQLWAARRPDVVHIATEGPLGWSALRVASRLGLPVCSDFRTNFHAYTEHYGIGWLRRPILGYLRGFHNRTSCTMVPTEALRRELADAGFQRLEVVSRGVDTAQFSPMRRDAGLRARWGADGDTLVVGCFGRLAPEKNLDALLESFAAVRLRVPGARLLLVGSGPLEARLRAACPDAILAGQRRGADLAAHYASADLFLFPSLTETFGNVTIEAMASGLPVVAYDYAAASQVIAAGENGVRVPFGDRRAFVDAALALAQDAPARRRLGAAARERALQLDWSAIVRRFETTLRISMRHRARAARLPGLGVQP
ncbi:MAG: glycosyltransferase family 1 protein [Xylophilus ampelinus]